MTRPHDVLDEIRSIPGVVEVGLFLGLADLVVVEDDGRVEVRRRPPGTRSAPLNLASRECTS
jgi:ribose 5-phosphate isomerase